MADKKTEVLVVGAGPVGLLSALVLVRRGVRVVVVDQDWRVGIHGYALGLHAESLAICQEVGILDSILTKAFPIQAVEVHDEANRLAVIPMPSAGKTFGPVVLPQMDLESCLGKALCAQGVEVCWGHRVVELTPTEGGVQVGIEKLIMETGGYGATQMDSCVCSSGTCEVSYVIGADGNRTTVRKLAGVPFVKAGDTQYFAVFECKLKNEPDPSVRVLLGDQTINGFWPMLNRNGRFLFQLLGKDIPRLSYVGDRKVVQLGSTLYPGLNRELLDRLIAERMPWFKNTIESVSWEITVPFDHGMASQFGKGRMWLAGDAAHMTSPVGAQSVNVGLREGHDLAVILAGILRDGNNTDQLEAYNRQRIEEWQFLLGLKPHIATEPLLVPEIGQFLPGLIPCLPSSGNELTRILKELKLESGELSVAGFKS